MIGKKEKITLASDHCEGLLKSEKGRWVLNIDESKYKTLKTSEEVGKIFDRLVLTIK